ncbi:Vacuolar protein sorting-associated protein 53, partial [Coemansia sp. RSA 2703]
RGSFAGLVACAFEPYLGVFVAAESRAFEQAVGEASAGSDAVDDAGVLASSTDLLLRFRESLRQCAALTTGTAMLQLSAAFGHALELYARTVLSAPPAPAAPSAQSASASASLMRAIAVVNTADYCATTSTQLERKLLERLSPHHAPHVSFALARDALLAALNRAIGAMVQATEHQCSGALAQLSQAPWHSLAAVGDQSEYVGVLAEHLAAAVRLVTGRLNAARYVRAYLDKMVVRVADLVYRAVAQCPGVSEVGAEQLLLDAQALKAILLALPQGASPDAGQIVQPSPAYARLVARGMGRVEALLKALLAPTVPPDALVDRFLLLFPGAPRDAFQHVLNLKRIRPPDQPAFHRLLQRSARSA